MVTSEIKNKEITMINLEIDGKPVQAAKGTTILNAARQLGIEIPTLCHDVRLKPYGSCRVCLVEVEGARGPLTACSAEVAEGMVVTTNSQTIKDLRKMSIELLLSNHWADCLAPCRLACPAGTDAQGYIGLISQKRYHEAVKLVKETNPLPSTIGRICTRPCEDACRRNLADERLNICWLKRFVGDYDLNSNDRYVPDIKPDTGKKVAVIGAGPSGLSAAYYLRLEGHQVTIFESLPQAGGMFMYGMPAYRLPKDLLLKEIQTILDLGVDIKFNTSLGKDVTLEDLKSQGYNAVFLGIGAQNSVPMGIVNENVEGVYSAIEFLRNIGLKKVESLEGKKVAVVGGGNSAIDAVRSSVRLGAKEVTLIYRRSRNEMPAHDLEIHEAEREGVKFLLLTNPTKVIGNGKVEALECVKMELGEPDSSGRRSPQPVLGSEFKIDVDLVIPAIGQAVAVDLLGDVAVNKRNLVTIDSGTTQTSIEGVFAGGDTVTGPKTAIGAIAAGRRSAIAINQYLAGEQIILPEPEFSAIKVGISSEEFADEPKIEKQKMPELEVNERNNFTEVEKGFSEEQALKEASRCLECGCIKQNNCDLRDLAIEYGAKADAFLGEMNHYKVDNRHPHVQQDMNKCILCAKCVRICDSVTGAEALTLANRAFDSRVAPAFDKPLTETTCVSCGQCISTCPTAALVENKGKFKREFLWPPEKEKTNCEQCSVNCEIENLKDEKGQIIGVSSDIDNSPNHGNLCILGRFNYGDNQSELIDKAKTAVNGGKNIEVNLDEVAGADYIIVAGFDPLDTHPVLGYKIRELAKAGKVKLAVINSTKTKLAEVAHHSFICGEAVSVVEAIKNSREVDGVSNEDLAYATKEYNEAKKALVFMI